MLNKTPHKSNSIFEDPALPSIYQASRKCLVEYPDGTTKEFPELFRMTLGFEKMKRLVGSLGVTPDDVVLSLFGGPGGTVRMLSLLRPRLLIAADILYPGRLPSCTGWHFAPAILFDEWVRQLEEQKLLNPKQIRYPIYIQLDVRESEPFLEGAVDKVVIDPPYGNVSERLLGITQQESKRILVAAMLLSERCLVMNGRVSCLCPRDWLDDHLFDQTSLKTQNIEVVGKSERFVLVQLIRQLQPDET